ncbi:uroporphyrinogen-III C-methyltransferase [uncultured Candidatus Kuenenia sp.]|jgi:uroporphyrinogen III methyltransferase/synthase|uniref:uroporphyrinogen-III C-methyltransferase n=1 Tax=uncultured Candidatus Kuenenia sp. TaxID=1048336 RepID=UPI001DC3C4CB|nr:uroporphyrinogen-III C-methyltransferase [uncultured Candidatus Kuenenia sp.]TVL94854.1 MAG: uroporphyrinogen-III C-methyltransferase [Candidatus Kuenenia stuttgartiensis]
MKRSIVYLVGAGPGDPGLITVKGRDCIKKADVIVYDYLVNVELLKAAKPGVEMIYVGKQGGSHTLEQEDINKLLVEKALEDKIVTRLKGGDPYIFGRGGEEALVLREYKIPFEVVPGITAAIATPNYAGIPVTHREYTSTFGLITGHEDPAKNESSIDWAKISTGIGTLAFYMGVKNLPYITEQLMKHGRSGDTPVAVIRWGTTFRQETVVGTLNTIVAKAKNIKPPAITIVGEVVKLRDQLNWFENRPLFGKTIVVTRSREQASEFADRLYEFGANVIEFPTIEIVKPDSIQPLDEAINTINTYDWLVFTSINGVDSFFQRLFELGKDVRVLKGLKICAIGPATAGGIERYHIRVDCKPPKFVAESVAEELKRVTAIKGERFLLPRADIARSYLPEELQKSGGEVNDLIVYKTLMGQPKDVNILEKVRNGEINIITFTSSSTVRNFVQLIGKENITSLKGHIQFASIGPITTKTAEEMGIDIAIKAKEYTIPGLVNAILESTSPIDK